MPRCVHCLQRFEGTTKDHAFPKWWYPDTTPEQVQRWTVPSCLECNNRLSRLEQELLIRMGLCVDPTQWEARGISAKALRSLGVGVERDLPEREADRRRAKKQSILARLLRYAPEQMGEQVLPGFGPHEGMPAEAQAVVLVPAEELTRVTEKIIRACEHKLGSDRYIEPPYELQVFFPVQEGIDEMRGYLANAEVTELGPDLEIRRRAAADDPLTVLYRLHIWGALTTFGSILRPDD
jgi:hypothetical protein